MNKNILLFAILTVFLMITAVQATSYVYQTSVNYIDGGIKVTAWTNDPTIVKVTFNVWKTTRHGSPLYQAKGIATVYNGSYYVATYTFEIPTDETTYVGESHFQSSGNFSLKIPWQITVPWLHTVTITILIATLVIFLLKTKYGPKPSKPLNKRE